MRLLSFIHNHKSYFLTRSSPPGPLAITSSAVTFTALSGSPKTVQYGVIVRNICNSTLSLLFTTALFIWGFVVNRKRAWRTDGGTAAFGAGALLLAVGSTAVNFLEVKVDKLSWLQHLLLSIILWQSWLGAPLPPSLSRPGFPALSDRPRLQDGGGGSAPGWASERSKT